MISELYPLEPQAAAPPENATTLLQQLMRYHIRPLPPLVWLQGGNVECFALQGTAAITPRFGNI